jgi:L,D-peptidoglycan transpeptidase YkuD (ErfK/YbiS/YcfS/YnhG family)
VPGRVAGPISGGYGASAMPAIVALVALWFGALIGIDTGAGATATAERTARYCTVPTSVPAAARQVVLVESAGGSTASVTLIVRAGASWTCAAGPLPARIGRNGLRPLSDRVAGDGTTPSGTFALGTMTAPNGDVFQFFGNGAKPGVTGGWHQVQPGDCWDATGGDGAYNTLVARLAGACSGDDEYLPSIVEAYSRAALIDANMGPARSGDQPGEVPRAAAIFLHRLSYNADGSTRATSGCVALAAEHLDTVLRALVPGQAWFVIRPA